MKDNHKVLHIVNYFTRQRLYINLIQKISQHHFAQYIYVPVRSVKEVGRNQEELPNVYFKYENILKKWDRVLYFNKIKKSLTKISNWLQPNEIDLVQAYTLFSDGGVAYLLKKKYNTKYILAIRQTDLKYLKVFPFLKSFALKVLRESEYIIFINPDLKTKLFRNFKTDEFEQKSLCIPNGINEYWTKNKSSPKKISREEIHFLYVGTFLKRKNVPLIIDTAKKLSTNRNVRLTIVGGGSRLTAKSQGDPQTLKAIDNAIKEGLNLKFLGRINEKEELRQIYRNADILLMPSRGETFGMVYIEAMSQGTPVIYAKNEGIDGFYEPGVVGYPVENYTVNEVVEKIELILQNYEEISVNCISETHNYKLDTIADRYVELYNKIIRN